MLRFELDDYQLPAWGSGYSLRLSLWQRCASLLMPRVLGIALSSSLVVLNSARRHRGLPMIMSYEQLFQRSLVLHNTAPGVDHARAAVPANHLYLGPILPRYAPEPQSIGMQTWLDLSLAREGKLAAIAVLTGIGSMTHLENWHVKHLYKGLTDQRLRVLWSLPSEYRPLLGAGIHPLFRFKTNLAPLSVFSHPSIKVVICSCGASMAYEALLHGKPLICLPTLADQLEVASRIVDGGAGLFLDKSMFEASEVRAKVMALITNSSFAANARRMGLILSAAGGLTRAVNTIETVTLTGSISPWLNLQIEVFRSNSSPAFCSTHSSSFLSTVFPGYPMASSSASGPAVVDAGGCLHVYRFNSSLTSLRSRHVQTRSRVASDHCPDESTSRRRAYIGPCRDSTSRCPYAGQSY
jgi:hypothetical protein